MNMKIFVAALALITIASFSAVSSAPSEPTHYRIWHFIDRQNCAVLEEAGLCTDFEDLNSLSCTCAIPVFQKVDVPELYIEGEDGANFGSSRV